MKITILYRHNQKDIGVQIFIRNKYRKLSNYILFQQDKKAEQNEPKILDEKNYG